MSAMPLQNYNHIVAKSSLTKVHRMAAQRRDLLIDLYHDHLGVNLSRKMWDILSDNIYGVGSGARLRTPEYCFCRRCSLVQSRKSGGVCLPLRCCNLRPFSSFDLSFFCYWEFYL